MVACGGPKNASEPASEPASAPRKGAAALTVNTPFPETPIIPIECPKGFNVVSGTPAADVLASAGAKSCIKADLGSDTITVDATHHRSVVLASEGNDQLTVLSASHVLASLGVGDDIFHGNGGAAAVWGGVGADQIFGGVGPDLLYGERDEDVISAGEGDDFVSGGGGDDILKGGGGADIIEADKGADFVDAGDGDDFVYGGNGPDQLIGASGADVIEGGEGDDVIEGNEGNDRIMGNGGDDIIRGGTGNDVIIPGAGVDDVDAGDGDDVVMILHACQAAREEVLDGGEGTDTLLTPLTVGELQSANVDIAGFEVIRTFPAEAFECNLETCDCGPAEHVPAIRRTDICDYSASVYELTEKQQTAAEDACNAMLDQLPGKVQALPSSFDEEDIEALLLPKWKDALAPTLIAQFGGATPHEPSHVPTNPIPNVSTSHEPCDMPQTPLEVRVAKGGVNNCNGGEKDRLNEALDHSRFMIFRMHQQIEAVLDAPTTAVATELWNRGLGDGWGRFALSNWFGSFDYNRAVAVRTTVAELEDIFYDSFPRHNVQCFHRLKPWQYFVFGLTTPSLVLEKTIANPCFLKRAYAHATYAAPFAGVALATIVHYPYESIEVCEAAFDDPTYVVPERLGGIVMHELLHFHHNSAGALRDRHPGDGNICTDGACYEEEVAEELADHMPNAAVVNIDNYRTWANATHTLYTDGYCDDTDPGICFTSDCCGDGVLQGDLSEICDGSDFGILDCLSEAGYSEGDLGCSADCQAIDTNDCHGVCGNNMLDPADSEQCDGDDMGEETCMSLFGSPMGSLHCDDSCSYEYGACAGVFPSGYFGCGVEPDSPCLQAAEECHLEAGAGTCTDGPCRRTDPGGRALGMTNPHSDFHPRGNFRDVDGHLYLCDDTADGTERTCVDEDGFGVCKECGLGDGQTMLGCPCNGATDCGLDMSCFGANFPQGGFCWPEPEGPPAFQCDEGACGQEFWGPDGGAYCEHYPMTGEARCMPQRCEDIPAIDCAEQDLICDAAGMACANECQSNADCTVGWPAGTLCLNDECVVP